MARESDTAAGVQTTTRWPRWIYGGDLDEPDYRFTLANERTFLAWIRTSLSLLAGAVALDVIDGLLPGPIRTLMAGLLLTLAITCAAAAWTRWAISERAIRRREALPPLRLSLILSSGMLVSGGAVLGLLTQR